MFDTYEQSRARGERISLYHFFYVSNEEFFYTDAESAIEKEGFSGPFVPTPIDRGNVTSTGTLDKSTLEVRMPKRVPIAEAFRVYPPDEVVNLTIYEMHVDDPAKEMMVTWAGRVLGASFEGNEVVLSCEPVSTSLKRPALRRNYQLGCPHALYGTQCAASKLLATTPDIAVVTVNGATVRLPPNWIPPGWAAAGKTAEKFVGGLLVWNVPTAGGSVEHRRTILRVSGGLDVILTGPATGLAPGANARMVLGCNHQQTDCQTVHNNIRNFGGQPFIPIKTPFGFANSFY